MHQDSRHFLTFFIKGLEVRGNHFHVAKRSTCACCIRCNSVFVQHPSLRIAGDRVQKKVSVRPIDFAPKTISASLPRKPQRPPTPALGRVDLNMQCAFGML